MKCLFLVATGDKLKPTPPKQRLVACFRNAAAIHSSVALNSGAL